MDSKVEVAIEFGYDEEIVNYVAHEKTFNDAGSLVDYLCQLSIEDDFREIREKISNMKMREEARRKHERKFINDELVKETYKLYMSSKCKRCREKNRNIVCLPCSHFSLCKLCAQISKHCPCCEDLIKETITVYLS